MPSHWQFTFFFWVLCLHPHAPETAAQFLFSSFEFFPLFLARRTSKWACGSGSPQLCGVVCGPGLIRNFVDSFLHNSFFLLIYKQMVRVAHCGSRPGTAQGRQQWMPGLQR